MQAAKSLLATFLLLVILPTGCEREDAPDVQVQSPNIVRPNIVWLTIESLRADHVGCYGYERPTTPNLDALADQSTLFEQASSVTSWTLTSHATMFTGLYPSAHKVIRPKGRLDDAHVTVAEVLAKAGYQTAAAVSGPYLRKAHNLQQGFQHFDDTPITPAKGNASGDITNPRMEASITRFLREQRDEGRPFFLFGYYWDTHALYIPPPPYDTMFVPPDAKKIEAGKIKFAPFFKVGKHMTQAQLRYMIAQYDGEIRCTDDYLGRLWTLLRELGLWDNTAIIVTSDHAEEFYEHGHNSHKNTLYVESLHVPLIVKWPGQTQPVRDNRLVNLIDLYPTVLELAGCQPTQPHSGYSLLEPPVANRPIFYELLTLWTFTRKSTKEKWLESDLWTAVRHGRYKLVHVKNRKNRRNVRKEDRWELYDCVEDPEELHPLGAGFEETIGELQGDLDKWREAMEILARRWKEGGSAQLTKEEEQRLRALGYLP